MPTMKPINVTWKLVPAGKGMSMIQSEPLPTEEAQLRMDDLDKEEAPGEPEEKEPMEMGAPGGKGGGMPGMPPFGKKPAGPAMEPMGAMARMKPAGGKPAMPPFGGM